MLITALIILTLLLIIFRILRGESVVDIYHEIKELKAQEVPHYFLRSLKIVFTFKGVGYKRKKRKAENAATDDAAKSEAEPQGRDVSSPRS